MADGTLKDHFTRKVLSPVGMDEFFASYWERQPLHVERDDLAHFNDLVSTADIEHVLSTQDIRFPECQLTQRGQHVEVSEYTDSSDRIIPLRIAQRHVDGATLVLSRAHRRFVGLSSLVSNATVALQWRCQANVYLSPPGRQGFNPHYDTHDVFILQVAGAKRFRFYRGGVDLPLVSDSFDPSTSIDPDVVEEVVLSAGDTLYIPRGMVHDAVAESDHSSLHVTLGVFPVCESDVARQCLQIASEHRVELRRSLSRDEWLNIGASSEPGTQQSLSSLSSDALAPYRAQALSRLRDEVFLEADSSCDGLLAEVANVNASETLGDDTVLVLTQSCLVAERQGNRLKLRTLGQVLEFEGAMAAAVEMILARGAFRVGELEGLDEQQRHLLGNRLLHERVVRVGIP